MTVWKPSVAAEWMEDVFLHTLCRWSVSPPCSSMFGFHLVHFLEGLQCTQCTNLYTRVVGFTFSTSIRVRLFRFINKSLVYHFVDYIHVDWRLSQNNTVILKWCCSTNMNSMKYALDKFLLIRLTCICFVNNYHRKTKSRVGDAGSHFFLTSLFCIWLWDQTTF